jgi:hypothetical protein
MSSAGIDRTPLTYEILISRCHVESNLEAAILLLDEMQNAKPEIEPTDKTRQTVVELAGNAGQPALALDMAEEFEKKKDRLLSPPTWMSILRSSLDDHYVSHPHHHLPSTCAGWRTDPHPFSPRHPVLRRRGTGP